MLFDDSAIHVERASVGSRGSGGRWSDRRLLLLNELRMNVMLGDLTVLLCKTGQQINEQEGKWRKRGK